MIKTIPSVEVTVCDACLCDNETSKEFFKNQSDIGLHSFSYGKREGIRKRISGIRKDLCDDCYEKMLSIVQDFFKASENNGN